MTAEQAVANFERETKPAMTRNEATREFLEAKARECDPEGHITPDALESFIVQALGIQERSLARMDQLEQTLRALKLA